MELAAAERTRLSICLDQRNKDLTAASNEVQALVDAALSRNELIREEVNIWLARSGVAQNWANELIDEGRNPYSTVTFRYASSHFSFAGYVQQEIINIQALLDEKRAFRGTVSDDVGIPSRNETAEKVIEALKDDKISIVGIYGMAGVGKTVLLNSLYQHFKKDRSFDQVVTVVISKHPEFRRIQDDLANQLNLQLNEEDNTSSRAKHLSEKLKEDEKVLILLDDLFDEIDLAQVGIPQKTSKIVFTTRSYRVCDLMGAQTRFNVAVLSQKDSLRLFKSNAGDAPDPTLAEDIVKECNGVPLAIVILGRALRGMDETSWNHALTSLKLSLNRINIGPLSIAIEVSYNILPSRTTKMCFLFCCLFPEDFKIPCATLLSYVVGENLIENVSSLDETRNYLNAIVEKLVSLHLLLKVDQDCLMMHDIVRDMALRIGYGMDNGFIVKAGIGLIEWPNMSFETCMRLSMMHNKLTSGVKGGLPTHVDAPRLSTLSLRGNPDLKEIPDKFFRKMKGLLTLDLSETCIVSLPQSLSCLLNLRTLCLDRCYYLKNITPIKKLKKLEILTLSQTRMQRLPKEMKRLVSLKMLDLSKAPNLVTIPPGVISSLSQLEELNVKDSFSRWEVGSSWIRRNATLSEIATLKHLSCLRLCVENLECLSQEMLQHWESINKFEILVGPIVSSLST